MYIYIYIFYYVILYQIEHQLIWDNTSRCKAEGGSQNAPEPTGRIAFLNVYRGLWLHILAKVVSESTGSNVFIKSGDWRSVMRNIFVRQNCKL